MCASAWRHLFNVFGMFLCSDSRSNVPLSHHHSVGCLNDYVVSRVVARHILNERDISENSLKVLDQSWKKFFCNTCFIKQNQHCAWTLSLSVINVSQTSWHDSWTNFPSQPLLRTPPPATAQLSDLSPLITLLCPHRPQLLWVNYGCSTIIFIVV